MRLIRDWKKGVEEVREEGRFFPRFFFFFIFFFFHQLCALLCFLLLVLSVYFLAHEEDSLCRKRSCIIVSSCFRRTGNEYISLVDLFCFVNLTTEQLFTHSRSGIHVISNDKPFDNNKLVTVKSAAGFILTLTVIVSCHHQQALS